LSILVSIISAVIPMIYGRLADEAVKQHPNIKFIAISLCIWLVFVTLSNWAARFVDYQGNFLGLRGYHSFVTDIFSHLIRLPIGFHKSKNTGEKLKTIDRAADFVWTIISDITFSLLPGLLTVVVVLVLMFLTNWLLALIVLIILLFYVWATFEKTKPIIHEQKRIEKYWSRAWGGVYDATGNIQIVKDYGQEKREVNKLSLALDRVVIKMMRFFWTWRDLSAWQNNIQGIGFVFVFASALYLLLEHKISAGVLISFIGYTNLVFRPFGQLANIYRQFQQGVVRIGESVKLYDLQTEDYVSGNILNNIKGNIEFKNIRFGYDSKESSILKNISFRVSAGQTVALVGESGTGKTTLLSLLSRYYKPDGGKILIDGVDIQNIDLSFLRRQIATVPQEISLFNATIKQNLLYGKPKATDKELEEALLGANALDFVNRFSKKINQLVGERGVKLSTGQKQRIAIARALLYNPRILILDEATSALDSVSERLVQEALKRLIEGRTTFVIAHRLSTIVHADIILVFDKGRLVERGTHEDLIKNEGVYWNLYQKQKF